MYIKKVKICNVCKEHDNKKKAKVVAKNNGTSYINVWEIEK